MQFLVQANRCRRSTPWLGVAGVLLSCTGQIQVPSDGVGNNPGAGGQTGSQSTSPGQGEEPLPVTVETACKVPDAVPLVLRRLTPVEYANTIKTLVGVEVAVEKLLAEPKALGFEGFATNQVASAALAEQWDALAEDTAKKAARDLTGLLRCDPRADAKCWSTFATSFGARAYRRPLSSGELTKHLAFLVAAEKVDGPAAAATAYLAAVLQSPSFLYRPEVLASLAVGPQQLDGWSMASRLSYLLWQDMPDEDLFDAARAQQLGTPADLKKQVIRMLADARAAKTIRHFSEQWLEIDSLESLVKDAATYPEFTAGVGALMKEEIGRFVESAMLNAGDGIDALFAGQQSFANADLANFYSWSLPASGDAFSSVKIPPMERRGILTLGGVMAVHGRPNQSSPIARGKFVRERILCQALPSPPNNIDIMAPVVRPGATTRERFGDHKSDPICAGCHELIDPVGFLFEHYDGAGRYRTKDQGLTVDASGEIVDAEGLEGQFADILGLVPKLAASRLVESCLTTQWFRFAFGREPQAEDNCTMAQLHDALATASGNIPDMLVALTLSPSFLSATAPQGVSP